MAWLWNSWDEYVSAVHPLEVRIGTFRGCRRNTQFESVRSLIGALDKLRKALSLLSELGFKGDGTSLPKDSSRARQAHGIVIEAVHAGEELLLYHKRLAIGRASYGFLQQNDLLDHWDRYEKTDRIAIEIELLVEDIRELLDGYDQMAREDESFIVDNLDLPVDLENDFRISRNLFSVGFEETGLLVAGRGLEGVLRQIARNRRIFLVNKGKATPASESDLYDLIETMSRIRWKVRGTPLISQEAKALLHYLRTTRNSGAHPGHSFQGSEDYRETAIVVANTANRLWKSVISSRARLDPTTVPKNW
jgi:hypothetical protein